MRSLYDFIVKPFKERYNNTKEIGDKELIVNSSIENHIFVSKKAVVVSTPAAYNTKVKIGDEVYVHHNIFRRYYDMKGREKNSGTFFKDDLYFCNPENTSDTMSLFTSLRTVSHGISGCSSPTDPSMYVPPTAGTTMVFCT